VARRAVAVKLGQSLGDGRYSSSAGFGVPLTNTATVASGTLLTNVTAATAVLVADGASPTQAHVTTLNTAVGLLATAVAATTTAAGSSNLVIDFDAAVITSLSQLRAAIDHALKILSGSDAVTP
jgi:hypothetical protein